ncbi:MAG TPA: TetR family transcriptional regulator [Nocardioidaceae bacterium]|nr:TetR family transcriptional regulator [Nocardioidaceae bacterium]
MARVTRAESKERTRQRLLAQAQRLFRERGYAATSLEQIAEAAEVTKGAIYGHFASKEDLMLCALEAAPTPDYSTTLSDPTRPLRDRLAEFSRRVAAEQAGDTEELAMYLEFFAALLRAPASLRRYSSGRERRLQELADADDSDSEDLADGVTPVQVWAIGQAMLVGLQIEQRLSPRLVTAEVFERAFGLLADLYREEPPSDRPLAEASAPPSVGRESRT